MGELPYRHYTFLIIGPGGGGLEHLNSTAVTLNPGSLADARGYQGWLSFIAHEYFHLFNVKSIRPGRPRPLRLRPRELHEHALVLRGRDGLLRVPAPQPGRADDPGRRPRAARLDHRRLRERPRAAPSIGDPFELRHLDGLLRPQRARGQHDHLLLRHRLRVGVPPRPPDPRGLRSGRSSLDDVMRTLYRTFYKEKKRGFTDREFRDVCERAAGVPLGEIFDVYARTVEPWDYARVFGLGRARDRSRAQAGRRAPGSAPRPRTRAGTRSSRRSRRTSPAALAGLCVQDEILAVDGTRVTPAVAGRGGQRPQTGGQDQGPLLEARHGPRDGGRAGPESRTDLPDQASRESDAVPKGPSRRPAETPLAARPAPLGDLSPGEEGNPYLFNRIPQLFAVGFRL